MKNNTTFREWIWDLDNMCQNSFGISYSDMPDLTHTRDLFDDGCSVEMAYDCCCENWASDDPLFAEVMGF